MGTFSADVSARRGPKGPESEPLPRDPAFCSMHSTKAHGITRPFAQAMSEARALTPKLGVGARGRGSQPGPSRG